MERHRIHMLARSIALAGMESVPVERRLQLVSEEYDIHQLYVEDGDWESRYRAYFMEGVGGGASPADELLIWDGVYLGMWAFAANTAMQLAQLPLQVAVRMDYLCEQNAYITADSRVKMAKVIREGLEAGVLGREANGEDSGWREVMQLLYDVSRSPGEVVLFSRGAAFPSVRTARWGGPGAVSAASGFDQLAHTTRWHWSMQGLQARADTLRWGPNRWHQWRAEHKVGALDLMGHDWRDRLGDAVRRVEEGKW